MDLHTWASTASVFAALLAQLGVLFYVADKLGTKIERLSARVDGLDAKLDTRTEELATKIQVTAERQDSKIDKAARHLNSKIDTNHADLLGAVNQTRTELGARLTSLEQRTYDLATRLAPAAAKRPSA